MLIFDFRCNSSVLCVSFDINSEMSFVASADDIIWEYFLIFQKKYIDIIYMHLGAYILHRSKVGSQELFKIESTDTALHRNKYTLSGFEASRLRCLTFF